MWWLISNSHCFSCHFQYNFSNKHLFSFVSDYILQASEIKCKFQRQIYTFPFFHHTYRILLEFKITPLHGLSIYLQIKIWSNTWIWLWRKWSINISWIQKYIHVHVVTKTNRKELLFKCDIVQCTFLHKRVPSWL